MEDTLESEGLKLEAHIAYPPPTAAKRHRRGLVLCHNFPTEAGGATTVSNTFPDLADRLAEELGWVALTFAFRGTGRSEGNFSVRGWIADLRAAIDRLLVEEKVDGVWLAGFGTGGTVALCVAAGDERVRGVATFGAQADFSAWAGDPKRFLQHARQVGVVRNQAFPPDADAWVRELREVRAIELVSAIAPRPVLLVHGGDDDDVPPYDARALSEAAGESVDLRLVAAAGHRLRHDPRAVALLIGWLGRQDV